MKDKLILVAGGGGFIGGHLVAHFRDQGYTRIRSVDIKPLDEWYQVFDDVENVQADLKLRDACTKPAAVRAKSTTSPPTWAAWASSKTTKRCACSRVLINTHLLQAAHEAKVDRFFYASSACVYNADKQTQRRRRAAQGRGRLPGDARRRLRLGEAVLRADVPPLPRGLRPHDPRGALPQRLRPATAPGTAAAKRRPPPSAAR